MKVSLSRLGTWFFFLACIIILALSVRGKAGIPDIATLNTTAWTDAGPFELSNERGRFALTYSVLEENSLHFSLPVARFALPDLGIKDGNYVSLFAPGVSYIVIPGYLIGKALGATQVGTFFLISLFAAANAALIAAIVRRMSGSKPAALLSALSFLFASPAFAYAVSLYQHHISTFLLLAAIYALMRWRSLWSLALIWLLYATAVVVDYPNAFFMMPVAIYGLLRFVRVRSLQRKIELIIRPAALLTLLAVILPIGLFLTFNDLSYGDPFQLSGTVERVTQIDADGQPIGTVAGLEHANLDDTPAEEKQAITFFQTRNLMNGFYTHFLSPERGMLVFAPVLLLGILGWVVYYRQRHPFLPLIVAVAGINVLLYSLWGDPYGGWAFGSRYMVPTYAMLAIGLGGLFMLSRFRLYFLMAFLILFVFSVGINALGALTSSSNPPTAELLASERGFVKVSYDRNIVYLQDKGTKSFLYGTAFAGRLTPTEYYALVTSLVLLLATVPMIQLIRLRNTR